MSTQQLLDQFGASVMDNIINAAMQQKRVSSGEAQRALKLEATDTQLKIIDGAGYLQWGWFEGRGPGSQPPLIDIINWLQQKQILQPNDKIKSAAFAIAQSIGQKGTALFQQHPTGDPIAAAINQTQMNSLLDIIAANYADEVKEKILTSFKS